MSASEHIPQSPARKGKIARLPKLVRDQLNQRLLDGQPGSVILPWLNELPLVKTAMKAHFGGVPISDANLSEWRRGGYQDWLGEQKEVAQLRAEADLALAIAKASNGQLSEGAAAIAAGKLLKLMRTADRAESIADLVEAVAAIRGGDIELKKLEAKLADGARLDRKLALETEKFRFDAAEQIERIGVKALREVLESKDAHPVKMDKLVKLIWGERPASQSAAAETSAA